MNASGVAEREPVKMIGSVVSMQCGATACVATLGALHAAQSSGSGQHVDVATFETQNGSLDRRRYYLLCYEYSGHVAERVRGGRRRPAGRRGPLRVPPTARRSPPGGSGPTTSIGWSRSSTTPS